MRQRTLALVGAAAVMALVVGCSGSDDSSDEESPADRLAVAKASLDDADFIGFTLSTDNLPGDVDGLVEASGTGTHEPAFTGDVNVKTALSINAPVIAVGGVVYADLPLVGWTEIDPAKYGAPDPAALMDTEAGLSSLFTATENPVAGDDERAGDEVLSTIKGTIPGDAVHDVFPSAGTDPFDVSYTLTSDNAIHGIDVTGPFYDGSDDVTYTLTFDLNADEVTIEPPS
jgi:lipoprotein LprG